MRSWKLILQIALFRNVFQKRKQCFDPGFWFISLYTRCELYRVTIKMRYINSFTHEPLRVMTHTAWVLVRLSGNKQGNITLTYKGTFLLADITGRPFYFFRTVSRFTLQILFEAIAWIFFRINWHGWIFFIWFPLREYLFVLCPPPPHKFSNGPSLRGRIRNCRFWSHVGRSGRKTKFVHKNVSLRDMIQKTDTSKLENGCRHTEAMFTLYREKLSGLVWTQPEL